jgi:hypothetical protein
LNDCLSLNFHLKAFFVLSRLLSANDSLVTHYKKILLYC